MNGFNRAARDDAFRVVIAGGGTAALEAALTLRELADERITMTMIAPDPDYVYRPFSVREPFGYAGAQRHSLADLSEDIGVELHGAALERVDARRRIVHASDGETLSYDALLIAVGARMHHRLTHVTTIDDRRIDEQLHGLIQDVEGGYVRRLVFVVAGPVSWPLPVYELALMTASRAFDMNIEMSITIVTCEAAPLDIFGTDVSEAVQQLLSDHMILTIPAAQCEIPAPGRVVINGDRALPADRIVAIPELKGPEVSGVPQAADGSGFIAVDPHGKVPGVERVYAAGDATNGSIKLGSLGARQADLAAQSIAALVSMAAAPPLVEPALHAMLLTGGRPRYLSSGQPGRPASRGEMSDRPPAFSAAQLVGARLGPYLQERTSPSSGLTNVASR